MKLRNLVGFGERLTHIRQSRGLTQADLGKAVGVSNRVIAYYETESGQPPGAMLVDLARALRISSDELLGIKPIKDQLSPKTARLLKRLEKIDLLSPADQSAVLKFLDAFLASRTLRSKPSIKKSRARSSSAQQM
jgi:transcriptional regulator with XRE-family HTH domain